MKPDHLFPWREHNQFRLQVDSEHFYPVMLDAINQARKFILLEQYLVSSGQALDQFIQALIAAAKRDVKIYIILDDYGAAGINSDDKAKLKHKNIHLVWYNPFRWQKLYQSMRRDHRKLLLVDNEHAYVGGAGITDHYLHNGSSEPENTMAWHDIMLEIHGQVVFDWFQSFTALWPKHKQNILPAIKQAQFDQDFLQPGKILLAHSTGRNHIIKSALKHMRRSRHRIWIATPYFVTTRKLRRTLKKAALRGIDVRLLLPGPISDHQWISQAARRYYTRLLRNGVKIYEYQPRFIHAKIILVDDWVSIGSCNLDSWSQFWNLDANQAVRDENLLTQVCEIFESDFKQSRLITYTEWKQRSLSQRIKEWWSSYLVRIIQWLVYFSTRVHKQPSVDASKN